MKTEVTVMLMVFKRFGAPKSLVTPGGGDPAGVLLNSSGLDCNNWLAILGKGRTIDLAYALAFCEFTDTLKRYSQAKTSMVSEA